MGGTLFVTDLDGTLLGADSLISPASVDMLNEAIGLGALFSIATARTPSTLEFIMRDVHAPLPYIVMTGSAMWNPETRRYSDVIHIAPETAQEVMNTFRRHSLPTFIYALKDEVIDVYHYGPLSDTEIQFLAGRDDPRFKSFHIPPEGTSILPDPLDDIVLFYAMQPSTHTEATWFDIREIPGCNPLYYHDIYGPDMGILEVFSSKASKANAIHTLRQKTGADRVIAFGDNINDLPMMREADLAVAVENALPEVKEAADIVIGANTTDAVARFILEATKENLSGKQSCKFTL